MLIIKKLMISGVIHRNKIAHFCDCFIVNTDGFRGQGNPKIGIFQCIGGEPLAASGLPTYTIPDPLNN